MTDLSKLLELDNGWLMQHRSEYLAWMDQVIAMQLGCPQFSKVRNIGLKVRSAYWSAGFDPDECFKALCQWAYGGGRV